LSDCLYYQDLYFTLEPAEACIIPGYVILRLKSGATAWGDLDPAEAGALGPMLRRVGEAVEKAAQAERVYCLVFSELDCRLHFHFFPRTRWLLQAYWDRTGRSNEPVNGPVLFEWARSVYSHGCPLPRESGDVSLVWQSILSKLKDTTI